MKKLFFHLKHSARRITALGLSAVLFVSVVKLAAPVAAVEAYTLEGEGYTDGLCPHHTVHTPECGYQKAVDCDHKHTEGGCFLVENGRLVVHAYHTAGDHDACGYSCDHRHNPDEAPYSCGYGGSDPLTCGHYGDGHTSACFITEGDFADGIDFVFNCSHLNGSNHDIGGSCAQYDTQTGEYGCPHDNTEWVGGHVGCSFQSFQPCGYVCTEGCVPASKIEMTLGQISFLDTDGNPVSNPLAVPYSELTDNMTVYNLAESYLPRAATVEVTVNAYVWVHDHYEERTATDPVTFELPLSLTWEHSGTGPDTLVANGNAYLFSCSTSLPGCPWGDFPDDVEKILSNAQLAAIEGAVGPLTGWDYNPIWKLADAYGSMNTTHLNNLPQFEISIYGYESDVPTDTNNNGYVEVADLNALLTYITENAGTGKALFIRLDNPDEFIEGTQSITIPKGRNVTLDLNGHALIYANEGSSLDSPALFNVESGATLTIEDLDEGEPRIPAKTSSTVSSAPGQLGDYVDDVLTYYVTKATSTGTSITTKFTVNMSNTGMIATMGTRAVVWVNEGGTLNFNGGRITNSDTGYHGIRSEGGNVTINGGLLVGTGTPLFVTYNENPSSAEALANTDSGAGIYCNGGSLVVKGDSYIAGNRTFASGNGAGIYATGMDTFRITGNAVIAGNLSQFGGGGVFVNESTHLTIDGSAVIAGNLAAYNGGGVYVEKWEDFDNGKCNSLTISGSAVITNNVAGRMLADTSLNGAGGGGVYAGGRITLEENTQITNNWAYDGGGGILIGYGRQVHKNDNPTLPEFYMTGGVIAGNRAGVTRDQQGGKTLATIPAVWNGEGITTDNIRGGATTGSEGGGIRLEGIGDISGGSIVNNETLTTFDFGGGGIFIESYGQLTLHDAVITGNSAQGYGGGVAACTNGTVTIKSGGTALYGNTANGTLGEGKDFGYGRDMISYGLTTNNLELGDGWPKLAGITDDGFAQDYFGARDSDIVDSTMLGGRDALWSGYMGGLAKYEDAEGNLIEPDEEDKVGTVKVVGTGIETIVEGSFDVYRVTSIPSGVGIEAKMLMALTSGYTGGAPSGKVRISGNSSTTHGGGIACNGELILNPSTPSSGTTPGTPSTQKTGSLTVTKVVTRVLHDDTQFNFTLTLSAGGSYPYTKYDESGAQIDSGRIGNGGSFTLSDDQSLVISNIPENATYTVTEDPVDGYTTTVTGSEGTITTAGVTAAFTNAKDELGSLTIHKSVVDEEDVLEGATPTFTFVVTFPDSDEGYTLTYTTDREGREDFKSGDAVTLAHGEAATISGLPGGLFFTVTELRRDDLEVPYTITSQSSGGTEAEDTIQGEIHSGRTVNVDMINTFSGGEEDKGDEGEDKDETKTGSLVIRKTVTGSGADLNRSFTFRVTLLDENGERLEGEFPCEGGQADTITSGDTFRLTHDQSLRITGLPIGARYVVVELDGNRGDYVTGQIERDGVISEEEAIAAYTNHKPDGNRYEEGGKVYVKVKVKVPIDPEDPESEEEEEEVWMLEDEVPLGNLELGDEESHVSVPQTGDSMELWFAMMLASSLGLLGLALDSILRRRQIRK